MSETEHEEHIYIQQLRGPFEPESAEHAKVGRLWAVAVQVPAGPRPIIRDLTRTEAEKVADALRGSNPRALVDELRTELSACWEALEDAILLIEAVEHTGISIETDEFSWSACHADYGIALLKVQDLRELREKRNE